MKINSKQIHLVHLPQWNLDQPPLGIAYLTGYLEDKGYKVVQFDYSINLYKELPVHKKPILESLNHEPWLHEGPFYEKIYPEIKNHLEWWALELAHSESEVIGFTVLSTSRIATEIVIKRIKEIAPKKIILIGGPHVTRYEGGFQFARNVNVDIVVPEEGEEVAHEILDALYAGRDISDIKGILYRRGNEVVDTGPRELIKNINELPIPIFSGFDLKAYKGLTIPILGSRGCIYSCAFCSETVLWKRYRYRTGENMFQEFKHHYETLGAKSFYIVDSLINGNIKELEKMCDLIIENGLEVWWGGKASIRRQMTLALLQKMKRAGCNVLDYGLESGSPKVVKDMKKGFALPVASEVIKASSEAGISVGTFLMAGFPTESEADFQMTLDFVKEHRPFIHHVTPGYGFGLQPGSEAFNNREKFGIVDKDGDWVSEFTTPEIRHDRVMRLRDFCRSLDFEIG